MKLVFSDATSQKFVSILPMLGPFLASLGEDTMPTELVPIDPEAVMTKFILQNKPGGPCGRAASHAALQAQADKKKAVLAIAYGDDSPSTVQCRTELAALEIKLTKSAKEVPTSASVRLGVIEAQSKFETSCSERAGCQKVSSSLRRG